MRAYDVRFNGADAPVEFSTDSLAEAIEVAKRLAEALPDRWAENGYRVEATSDGYIEMILVDRRESPDDWL